MGCSAAAAFRKLVITLSREEYAAGAKLLVGHLEATEATITYSIKASTRIRQQGGRITNASIQTMAPHSPNSEDHW